METIAMKLKALWILLVFVPAMSADTIMCSAGAVSIPVFDPSSVSGAVGDYTLDCTGGTPVLPPDPVPQMNFDAFMNVSVLNTGGWILTDGVNMTPGILGLGNQIEFLGVPFNPPGTGHVLFEVENIFVNPSGELPGFQFMEDLTVSGNLAITIKNPQQLVAVNAVPEPFMLGFVGVSLGTMWLRRSLVSRAAATEIENRSSAKTAFL
jgi:hypothetical protein